MPLGPSQVITSPQPSPARHGILDGATESVIPTDPSTGAKDRRWEMGFSFYSSGCGRTRCWAPICLTNEELEVQEKCVENLGQLVKIQPFTLYVGETCSTTGFAETDYAGRVRAAFEQSMPQALETAFWSGSCAGVTEECSQFLADEDAEVLCDGAPLDPKQAFGALLQHLAKCSSGRGTIHASPYLASIWFSLGLVRVDQNRLVTAIGGHSVIAGPGYLGTGPGGAAPPDNHHWAYVTGALYYRLSDVELIPETFEQAVDTRRNTVTYIAERSAAVFHDGCCQAGVLVDLCGGCC